MRLDVKRIAILVVLALGGAYLGLQVWCPTRETWTGEQPVDRSSGPGAVTADPNKVFYNRVSKCGSTTLKALIHILASKNRFVEHTSRIYNERLVSEEQQKNIASYFSLVPGPALFDRHLYFLDFRKYGYRPPVHINLVRDPVERLISTFSYRRQTAHMRSSKQPSKFWLHKTFEDCVLKKDSECLFIDGNSYTTLQVTFFCGHFEECKILGHPWALQQAKANIANSYAVVGVVEEWNMTLAVLEATLPQFFRGATQIYYTQMPGYRLNRSQSKFKQKVSQQVKDVLKANLSHEYELYHFALQRLHQQYRGLESFH